MRPGRIHWPRASICRAPAGTATPLRGPTAVMRPPPISTTASGIGAPPLPSMTVPPTSAVTLAAACPSRPSGDAAEADLSRRSGDAAEADLSRRSDEVAEAEECAVGRARAASSAAATHVVEIVRRTRRVYGSELRPRQRPLSPLATPVPASDLRPRQRPPSPPPCYHHVWPSTN